MVVMAFDLSSACIGVTAVEINGTSVVRMKSCPIIPPNFDPTVLGYMKTKKKLPVKSGELINTYYKKGETSISKKNKKKRDCEVRSQKDIFVLQHISKIMNNLITSVNPDLILVEKNEIFNGILTSILLGKVMGTLVSITGVQGIPLIEKKVNESRSSFDMKKILSDFRERHSPEELKVIPDITKRALREYLQEIYGPYGVDFQTDDESDSCVIFHSWFTEIREGQE